MLKKILLGLAAVIVVFLVVVAFQPADYRVSRSTTISAPPSAVFPQVNELKKWEAWNPWGKLDPAMKTTYSGPEGGPGAVYAWVGNNDIGEGKLTIMESEANERIRVQLEFFKPMAGVSLSEFTFKPEGEGTSVTWSMTGKNNFVGKAFCLFMNMDTMIGTSFEQGLASLKAVAETKIEP
jgi:uncharacterized protein YndB with AHSA1/START domain